MDQIVAIASGVLSVIAAAVVTLVTVRDKLRELKGVRYAMVAVAAGVRFVTPEGALDTVSFGRAKRARFRGPVFVHGVTMCDFHKYDWIVVDDNFVFASPNIIHVSDSTKIDSVIKDAL